MEKRYKGLLDLVGDLENIEDEKSKMVIEAIDKTKNWDNWLLERLEIGMRLVFEKHGFDHYMQYEEAFEMTIFWREKDKEWYHAKYKEYSQRKNPEYFDENGEWKDYKEIEKIKANGEGIS